MCAIRNMSTFKSTGAGFSNYTMNKYTLAQHKLKKYIKRQLDTDEQFIIIQCRYVSSAHSKKVHMQKTDSASKLF